MTAGSAGSTGAARGPLPRASYRQDARRFYTFPAALRLPGILLLLASGGLFYWTIGRMWLRWNNTHSYYSHGPLIVPIAVVTAWLIIRNRGLPMHSTPGSRAAGLVLLTGALLVHLASMYALVTFVSGFMMIPLLAGCVLYLGGWPMFGRLWFPIVFLAFMVPLPDLTIADINFRLKMLAAEVSTAIVNGLGVVAHLRGAEISLLNNKRLTVEDACSGLRSLISLLAFATLFTYACKLRGYKRFVLFASAVPVAVAANIVRIVVLTLVANAYGVSLAVPGGWVHDVMGFVVFVIAFCFLFLLEEVLDLLPGARSDKWLGAGLLGGKAAST
jgi:exosortase